MRYLFVSRSGATIEIPVCWILASWKSREISALYRPCAKKFNKSTTGLDRSFAVRFSFLMSLPAVLGANILSLAKAAKAGSDVSLMPAYLIGMLVAMVSGIAAIGLVKRLTSKGRFGAFSYYCWGAGALTMILSLIF